MSCCHERIDEINPNYNLGIWPFDVCLNTLNSLYLASWASVSRPCLFCVHYPSGLTCCCDSTVFLKQPNPKCSFDRFLCPDLTRSPVHSAMKQHVVVAKWDGFPHNPPRCWGYFEILNDKHKVAQTHAKVMLLLRTSWRLLGNAHIHCCKESWTSGVTNFPALNTKPVAFLTSQDISI